MPSTKKAAIEMLEGAIGPILSLKYPGGVNSANFLAWRRATKKIISDIFGKDSDHVREFEGITYIPTFIGQEYTPDSYHRMAYQSGLDKARELLKSMTQEIQQHWPDRPVEPGRTAFPTRFIFAVLFGLAGIGVLFLPQIRNWTWLQQHQNRLGLYAAEILIVFGISWAIADPNRRQVALGSVVLGAVLVLVQIIGK